MRLNRRDLLLGAAAFGLAACAPTVSYTHLTLPTRLMV